MKTIACNTQAEVVEKKSKFICNLYYVESIEEAETKIKEIKKKYYDAKHNCFAYRVVEQNAIIEKASDDGEPSGTAGAPMLNLLSKLHITNCLVIVTRYFGGVLLGTGGLVRAYTEAAKQAIEKTKIIDIQQGEELELEIDYDKFEKFQHYCQVNNIIIKNVDYIQNIICKIQVGIKIKETLLCEEIKRQYNIKNIKILGNVYINS